MQTVTFALFFGQFYSGKQSRRRLPISAVNMRISENMNVAKRSEEIRLKKIEFLQDFMDKN